MSSFLGVFFRCSLTMQSGVNLISPPSTSEFKRPRDTSPCSGTEHWLFMKTCHRRPETPEPYDIPTYYLQNCCPEYAWGCDLCHGNFDAHDEVNCFFRSLSNGGYFFFVCMYCVKRIVKSGCCEYHYEPAEEENDSDAFFSN